MFQNKDCIKSTQTSILIHCLFSVCVCTFTSYNHTYGEYHTAIYSSMPHVPVNVMQQELYVG